MEKILEGHKVIKPVAFSVVRKQKKERLRKRIFEIYIHKDQDLYG
jgi:hypothetical protein